MRPVSAEFLEALRGPHRMVAGARIVTGHQTGVAPTGVDIPILGGDVVSDATADVRSTLDLTTGRDLSSETPVTWPDSAADLLTSYGNEIFCFRGIEFGDRHDEIVSLGYYRIDTVSQEDVPTGAFAVTASDRMAGIVDGRLIQPVQFKTGHPVEDVFTQLITEVYPDAVVEFDEPLGTLGRSVVVEEERYEFLRDLAASHSKDFYVDYRGIFVIKSSPDPGEPVFAVNAGAGGVLVRMGREISREGVYNGVVATGEGADEVEPVRGVAVDNNFRSPTYWNGENAFGSTYGKVPKFYSSPFLVTVAQAWGAARKILVDNLGLPFSVDFATVPNPALEPNDPVLVTIADHNKVHILQTVTTPLTAGAEMTAITRDLTDVLVGLT